MLRASGKSIRVESELFQWIRQQESEGVLHSEGTFTLAQEQAWKKLGSFQLPFPEAWVLKFVQAAVRAGLSELKVVQSRSDTQFFFEGPLDWGIRELERGLFDMEFEAPEALRHLVVGIRALAGASVRPFSVRFQGVPARHWDGSRFQQAEQVVASASSLVLSVSHFEIGHSRSIFSLDNREARAVSTAILKALTDHCFPSPIPLFVDGRRINGIVNESYYQPRETCRPLAFVTLPPSAELPAFSLLQFEDWQQAQVSGQDVRLDSDEELFSSLSTAGAMALACVFFKQKEPDLSGAQTGCKPGRSTLAWVRDGVVVERELLSIRECVGLLVLVSAEGLKTDLSGLKVRDGAEATLRKCHALYGVGQQLEQIREGSSDGVRVTGQVESHVWMYWGAGALLMGVVNPLVGFLMVGHAGFLWLSRKESTSGLDQRLDESLDSVIRGLAKWEPRT